MSIGVCDALMSKQVCNAPMLKPRSRSAMCQCQRLKGSRDSSSLGKGYWVRLTRFSPKWPKSVMSWWCRLKIDFPKTPIAYRTDCVRGAKFVPPTVQCIVGDDRSRSAGRRHAEKMPTPNSSSGGGGIARFNFFIYGTSGMWSMDTCK
jgi:hypothetical protein